MGRNQPILLEPTYLPFWTHWRKPMFPQRSARVTEAGNNVNVSWMFDLRLWCYCKACQCVSVSWMLFVKFQIEWRCLVKHFAFLKNVCYEYVNFVLWVTYCFFMSWWLTHNQLSWNVLLFSCNLICQLCLSDPSYSSHTVNVVVTKISSCLVGGELNSKEAFFDSILLLFSEKVSYSFIPRGVERNPMPLVTALAIHWNFSLMINCNHRVQRNSFLQLAIWASWS